jgi:predicted metalloprotease with PDZ domain
VTSDRRRDSRVVVAWAPCSYAINDYARYVRVFAAHDDGGSPLRWERAGKDTWCVCGQCSRRGLIGGTTN